MARRLFSILGLFIYINTYTISQTSLTVAENFNVKTPTGETINLYDILDNGQHVVIDFFNITCGPCQVFAPDIQISSEHFGNNEEDVFFVGISYSGDNNLIVQWDSTYGITYPTISGSDGGGVGVHIDYSILSVPTIVLIAPDKNIIGQLFLPDFIPATSVIDSMLMAHELFPVVTEVQNNNQNQIREIVIYPNPVKDKAMLELDVTKNSHLEIELINLFGNRVFQMSEMPFQNGKHSIELSFKNVSKGIYILNITENNLVIYNQKVILE
ncbi:MAG: T9SS type A sorting domain-containing protein [Bacteroidales bacterium]|nr:T9SS type A sorting domain-containing protein [Bacteroidales bacterium]